jgi:hypothetical protein
MIICFYNFLQSGWQEAQSSGLTAYTYEMRGYIVSLVQTVTRTWVERPPIDARCQSNVRTSTELNVDRIQMTLTADLFITVINTMVYPTLMIEYFVFWISSSNVATHEDNLSLSLSPHWLQCCYVSVSATNSQIAGSDGSCRFCSNNTIH